MPKSVSWIDFAVVIINLYLAYFHFRNSTLGIVLAVAALIHLWVIKQSFEIDFR